MAERRIGFINEFLHDKSPSMTITDEFESRPRKRLQQQGTRRASAHSAKMPVVPVNTKWQQGILPQNRRYPSGCVWRTPVDRKAMKIVAAHE